MSQPTDLRLPSRLRSSPVYASVLREDPDLAQGLSEADRRAAFSLFRAAVIHAAGQRWSPHPYDPARTFGLLILDGLLLLDSTTAALIVVLPVGLAIWASALRYLIRGAIAANRGERSEVPDWICAHIVG